MVKSFYRSKNRRDFEYVLREGGLIKKCQMCGVKYLNIGKLLRNKERKC